MKDAAFSLVAFGDGLSSSLMDSLPDAVGELDDVAGARLSSLSLVEGPRTSLEESLSEPSNSSEDGERGHFLLWRVIGRSGGLEESSEDVGLTGGGLPGGVVMVEKLRCGTVILEISGVSKWRQQRVALTRTGSLGSEIGVVQTGLRSLR